jgi:hypothetical protein
VIVKGRSLGWHKEALQQAVGWAYFIAKLVKDLITETNLVGLMCDGSQCQTYYAHLERLGVEFIG